MRALTQQAFSNILDTMTGTDGAIRFIRFKVLIEDLDKKSLEGDEAAEQLIVLMKRFSKLIDIANEKWDIIVTIEGIWFVSHIQ